MRISGWLTAADSNHAKIPTSRANTARVVGHPRGTRRSAEVASATPQGKLFALLRIPTRISGWLTAADFHACKNPHISCQHRASCGAPAREEIPAFAGNVKRVLRHLRRGPPSRTASFVLWVSGALVVGLRLRPSFCGAGDLSLRRNCNGPKRLFRMPRGQGGACLAFVTEFAFAGSFGDVHNSQRFV